MLFIFYFISCNQKHHYQEWQQKFTMMKKFEGNNGTKQKFAVLYLHDHGRYDDFERIKLCVESGMIVGIIVLGSFHKFAGEN